MLAVGYQLPKVVAIAMPPPGADGEAQKKAKFEKDFIIVSEFSEQVGPIPIGIIPENGSGTFDTGHFSVRIMSSDFQSATGKFSLSKDTQVILSEKVDGAYGYVHYFCLNDIHARGYVRQFCISYITSSMNKLTDHFEGLYRLFTEVTTLLKCGNHRVFGKDLEHHLADLEHTSAMLEDEGWAGRDEVDQRYAGFDFGSENVPERDPSVVRHAIDETKDIMEILKKEMSQEHNENTQVYLEKQRKSFRQLQQLRGPSDSPVVRREGQFTTYIPVNFLQPTTSPDLGIAQSVSSVASDLSSSSEVSLYEPQRVMAHIVHKFDRRLRPLQELSPRAYLVAMEKMKEIYQHYSRSEAALEMVSDEALFLDPHSSLLTIGRVPHFNALQDHWTHISQPSSLLKSVPYQLSSKNTWGQPLDIQTLDSSMHCEVIDGVMEGCSSFDTGFLQDGSALNKWPLYLDSCNRLESSLSYEQTGLDYPSNASASTLEQGHVTHENGGSQESTAYNTPQAFQTPETSPTPLSSNSNSPSEREEGSHTVVGFTADSNPSFNSVKPVSDTRTRLERTSQPLSESDQQQDHPGTDQASTMVNGSAPCSPPSIPMLILPQSPKVINMSGGKGKSLSSMFSINSDQPTDNVFSSSVDRWDGTQKGLSKKRRRSPGRDVNGGDFDESFEGSYDGFVKAGSKKHSSPLLRSGRSKKSDKHSPERQGSPRASKKKGRGQPEGDGGQPGKKGPGDLKITKNTEGETSPEFYSPVGAPPGNFSMGGLGSPLSPQSIVSVDSRTRWPPLLELRGKSKLPFISSVDQIEGDYRFKPGRGILNFCKDNANVRDLLYCLLHGRPLIILGKDENLIRRLVRTLWLFVPGHSSRHQVILWQKTPLYIKDLSRVRLMGLHCQGPSDLPGAHMRKYVSYWDCNAGKLYTPQYRGELLKPILTRNKDRKNEQVFLTHIHSVLSDIAMRAFIYYHGHCTFQPTPHWRTMSASAETAPRKYHHVSVDPPRKARSNFLQQLGVKDSDVDIIEYFVEVLREQQLLEWKADGTSHGGPGNDGPVALKLHTKLCSESYCKAKKPY